MRPPIQEFDPNQLYDFDPVEKKYILNITAKTFKDLYNKWDYSPYKKRDLNEALVKYIEDCSEEMPVRHKVEIHLYISSDQDSEKDKQEATSAIKSYFKYLLFKKVGERKKYNKNARLYGLAGLLSLSLALFFQKLSTDNAFLTLLPEGFYIGGWVLFWEVCTILFFKYRDISQKIREYSRLHEAKVVFHFEKTVAPLSKLVYPELPKPHSHLTSSK